MLVAAFCLNDDNKKSVTRTHAAKIVSVLVLTDLAGVFTATWYSSSSGSGAVIMFSFTVVCRREFASMLFMERVTAGE
jgi:hypothetical protein